MGLRLEVSVGRQQLEVWEGAILRKTYAISTSKHGLGSREGSFCTPLGWFRVSTKHGHNAAPSTVFKARQPMGEWDGAARQGDLILARILCLEGCEPHNANTAARYIYLHGTNDEPRIGQRASQGCIRMKNADIIELFEWIEEGTPVWIEE